MEHPDEIVRLLRCIRSRDYAFRIGGDEFALIVSADMDEEQRSRMAERIQTMLSAPICIIIINYCIYSIVIRVASKYLPLHLRGKAEANTVMIYGFSTQGGRDACSVRQMQEPDVPYR